METGWTVIALQLDLLDNKPAVSVQHAISGEVVTVDPYRLRDIDFDADKKTVWGAGYLQGYSDRHYSCRFAAVQGENSR